MDGSLLGLTDSAQEQRCEWFDLPGLLLCEKAPAFGNKRLEHRNNGRTDGDIGKRTFLDVENANLHGIAIKTRNCSTGVEPLVLQNAGPHAPEAMPEAGYLPIPKKLAQRGVKDMVRISDARMSGTAFGTIVLHVTPDAASGGPLGLVRNGDRIRLSVKERRIALLVDDAELKRRVAPVQPEADKPTRGYSKLYAEQILGADEGCDFAFLRPK